MKSCSFNGILGRRPSPECTSVLELSDRVCLSKNAQVFPVGNFDKAQDDSLHATAIRETFEETGLLLALSGRESNVSDAELDTAREAIHVQEQSFRDFLALHNLSLDVSSLLFLVRRRKGALSRSQFRACASQEDVCFSPT